MSVPNFSSLAGLEVAEKFVVVGWGGWNTWLLCLTPTLVALELLWVELSCVGFWQYFKLTFCGDFDTLQNVLTCSVLKQYHTSKEVTDRNVEYNNIYSEDIFKQQKVTKLYNQLIRCKKQSNSEHTSCIYHWSHAWLPSRAKSFMILGIKIDKKI